MYLTTFVMEGIKFVCYPSVLVITFFGVFIHLGLKLPLSCHRVDVQNIYRYFFAI